MATSEQIERKRIEKIGRLRENDVVRMCPTVQGQFAFQIHKSTRHQGEEFVRPARGMRKESTGRSRHISPSAWNATAGGKTERGASLLISQEQDLAF